MILLGATVLRIFLEELLAALLAATTRTLMVWWKTA